MKAKSLFRNQYIYSAKYFKNTFQKGDILQGWQNGNTVMITGIGITRFLYEYFPTRGLIVREFVASMDNRAGWEKISKYDAENIFKNKEYKYMVKHEIKKEVLNEQNNKISTTIKESSLVRGFSGNQKELV